MLVRLVLHATFCFDDDDFSTLVLASIWVISFGGIVMIVVDGHSVGGGGGDGNDGIGDIVF